jgi:retron-type reverse transcriptase
MPRTYNKLIDAICSFDNLYTAYIKARKCKRYKSDVLKFSNNLEEELFALQKDLSTGGYKTGSYKKFTIFEPKKREISALPFRDRVVHHALCGVIEPFFENKFINDSYACRKGKGTHAASSVLTEYLRRSNRIWDKAYCLKGDIEKCFHSIDHEILKRIIRRTVRCRDTLILIDEIIDSTGGIKGIPIGNLTSQLFANVYLNELDHFVKEKLKVKFYVRYLDDFIIIYRDKEMVQAWRSEIEQFVEKQLRLALNTKTSVFPVKQGVDFVGYRTWSTHKLLRKRSVIGMKRKLRNLSVLYREDRVTLKDIKCVLASWLGHAQHADSYNVVKRVLKNFVLCKT